MNRTLLIVEDEPNLAFLLRWNLEVEGFAVVTASDGDAAVSAVRDQPLDLIILDLMLPRRSGLDVLREVRRRRPKLPVIILTARTGLDDRVQGLKLGADDYISKPFEMAELLARVQAVLRRTALAPGPNEIDLGDLHVDFVRMTARRKNRDLALSSREFRVLRALARRRGEVVTRDELLRAAWSADEAVTERTVDAHIKNLRKKIEADPANPVFLRTVHREGYMLIL